jgi:hypothetical protein
MEYDRCRPNDSTARGWAACLTMGESAISILVCCIGNHEWNVLSGVRAPPPPAATVGTSPWVKVLDGPGGKGGHRP